MRQTRIEADKLFFRGRLRQRREEEPEIRREEPGQGGEGEEQAEQGDGQQGPEQHHGQTKKEGKIRR